MFSNVEQKELEMVNGGLSGGDLGGGMVSLPGRDGGRDLILTEIGMGGMEVVQPGSPGRNLGTEALWCFTARTNICIYTPPPPPPPPSGGCNC